MTEIAPFEVFVHYGFVCVLSGDSRHWDGHWDTPMTGGHVGRLDPDGFVICTGLHTEWITMSLELLPSRPDVQTMTQAWEEGAEASFDAVYGTRLTVQTFDHWYPGGDLTASDSSYRVLALARQRRNGQEVEELGPLDAERRIDNAVERHHLCIWPEPPSKPVLHKTRGFHYMA